jgi:glycerate kinase
MRVAVDVRNPLIGPKGASRIYGPQKGLEPSDFAFADGCLDNLARVWAKQFGRDLKREPGAGAAGGLGFGLMAFLGAKLEPGFDLFAQHSGLNRFLQSSDLVITGEGAIDQSTLMGKGVGQLASTCLKWKKPCIALAGTVTRSNPVRKIFYQARGLTDIADETYAKLHAGKVLTSLSRLMAQELTIAFFTSQLDHA